VTEIQSGLATAAALTTIDDFLDTEIAAILEDTGTTLPATLATLATAAALATIDDFLDTEVAAILADTNELQTDWANGGRLDLLVDAILEDTGTTLDDLIDTEVAAILAAVDTEVAAILADTNELQTDWHDGGRLDLLLDAAAGSTAGSGAITFVYTLTSSVDASAIADADVWVTSDQAGNTVVASGRTNTSGQVTFYLDAGTYYVWRQKAGWNFTNPDTETVA
jgi:hypothetical protein